MPATTKRPTKGPRFCGALDEPILSPNVWTTAFVMDANRDCEAAQKAISDLSRDWVQHQKIEKLNLLAERYDVTLGELWVAWSYLCLRLAEDCVPGFRVVDKAPKGRGHPKGPRRNRPSKFELVKVIDLLCATDKIKVAEACRRLARDRKSPWQGRSATSLANDYRLWFKEMRALKRSDFWRACEAAAANARELHHNEQSPPK